MRKSGYRTMLHIYLIFFLALLVTILAAICLVFRMITIQQPNGSTVRSDWANAFTEEFQNHIILIDGDLQVTQEGISLLLEDGIGIQVLDPSGKERYEFRKPAQAQAAYVGTSLLGLAQEGQLEDGQITAFVGVVSLAGKEYPYILYFPMKISKVTMFVNGDRFAGGKTMVFSVLGVLLVIVMAFGVLYGLLTTRAMRRLTASMEDISRRRYLPIHKHGVFRDLYHSLNTLDGEIKESDTLQAQTETMRAEWIANITHDLRTPLSSIRGYAELLQEERGKSHEQCRRYAEIMLKNAAYLETLVEDLKLTYQLENGMIPLNRNEQNLVRFLKELVIDILNTPEYVNRIVHFESETETVFLAFDNTLLTRAFQNIIVNAFVHGDANTEVSIRVSATPAEVQISVADNGKGMESAECERLFERYYRGTNTAQKPEGTGLGLAIAKSVIEHHGGQIAAFSHPHVGTTFQIAFPIR